MDRVGQFVVVVRLVAPDGSRLRSVSLRWVEWPSAAQVVAELCVRALQARRDGCDLVVVEPAELVLLLAAAGLGPPGGPFALG